MTFAFPAGFPRPFGPCLLLSSFGRGGMGEVFLAKRRQLAGVDDLCVVKTLRRDLSQDSSYVRRFLDEARIVVLLSHGNICPVFDAGQVGPDYFMSMEYIAGANLREVLARVMGAGDEIPRDVALYVVSEMLRALSYAHRLTHPLSGEPLRLVHRDISPHNVMVGFDGRVKLIDFGLAESTLKQEQTESAIVMGKVAYMAPEQARGEDVDARCDQYAVGVLLYELLTHDRYYGDLTTPQIWEIAGRGGHVPRRLDCLDDELQAIVARATASAPSRRFSSCDELLGAIDRYRAAKDVNASRDSAQRWLVPYYKAQILDERELRAACQHLRAPDPRQEAAAASLFIERDDVTRSVTLHDPDGGKRKLPLGPLPSGAPVFTPRAAKKKAPLGPIAAGIGAVVATAATVALLVLEPGTAPAIVDEANVVVPPPTERELLPSAPPREAVVVAPEPLVEPSPPAVAEPSSPTPTKQVRKVRRPKKQKQESAPLEDKPAAEATSDVESAPVVAVVKTPPPREHSLAESIQVMKQCDKPCASEVVSVAEGLTEDKFRTSVGRRAILHCVKACLDE